MGACSWFKVALVVFSFANGAVAQDLPSELTPVGKAILQAKVAAKDRSGSGKPTDFPSAMCTFPGGLCGAVWRDGSVAVPPRYDWVGSFAEKRAAVRIRGLYGLVDDEGHEVVTPQYSLVDDYKFGFAQVEVEGRSGLIDRSGKMIFAPTYGFIEAIGPDRFQVSDVRRRGGKVGSENFSGITVTHTADGVSVSFPFDFMNSGVIDMSGQWIQPPGLPPREFDKGNPTVHWVESDGLWGLLQADGNWLVQPRYQKAEGLSDGLARVTLDGKVGFVDGSGQLTIEPVFDKAWPFRLGIGRTSAERDGSVGVIDRSGSWIFQTSYQQIHLAIARHREPHSESPFGWHFKQADRWGLLDLDGRVLLAAEFDQPVEACQDRRLVAYMNKEWLYYTGDGSPLQPLGGRLIDATCGRAPPYTLKIGDKLQLVDARSRPLAPMQFDAVTPVGPDAKDVKIDGKWGRIRSDGSWLIEPRFDYLSNNSDPLVASIAGKRGIMKLDGTWLIEPKFDAARIRPDGTAFVSSAGATGIIRIKDQSWVMQPRPGVMCDIDNAIMSQAGGKRVILSPGGEVWIDADAVRVGINLDFGLLTFLKDGKWGLVDTAGHVTAEPQYDEPVYFALHYRGIAWAKQNGKWCPIDRRNHAVPGIACSDVNPAPTLAPRFECKIEP
ncbi:WG repeat-containing protein [Bradyrhizobium sp.]|uniref:WG repeat-containing protein n=1 Tax=Bradyrhizobium sp. TaxID=376 RepID=UPI002DDD7085|nr:WG repeat-containing protein [Bradyrhizobium sp.]HEV2153290.1 WG repeat-containing protein [Bradyrhizobium sp.]